MRKRIGILSALALIGAMFVPAPASADVHDQVSVFADEFTTQIDLTLSAAVSTWTRVEGWIGADAVGGPEAQSDTEVGEFFLEFGQVPQPVNIVQVGGAAPDRWDGGTLGHAGQQLTFQLSTGNNPLLCGESVAQLFMEIWDGENVLASLDLRDIPTQPCPVIADLETVLDDGAYLFDSSGDRFQFTGEQVTFNPGVTNEGPDDETETGFDFRIGYFGVADDPNLLDDPEPGVDFTWTLDPDCFEFGVNTLAPTAICRNLGPLPAGSTSTRPVVVDWILPGDYFAATIIPFDFDRGTLDGDGTPNSLHRFQVLAPDGDFDGDGIANAVDRSPSDWQPLTSSSSFDDREWPGGTTYGTVTSGNVLVADDAAGGVVVDAVTAATLTACGFPVSLQAGTVASIECGSITVSVVSGEVVLELEDGSTVTLNDGDEVTADPTSVTVNSGSATVTPSGGGDPIVLGEGETLNFDGADTDGDGVLDADDLCPGTVDETGSFDLKKNHYAWDGFAFVDVDGESPDSITVADTGGCSAGQIIDELGLGKGHERFGITKSALMDWIEHIAG